MYTGYNLKLENDYSTFYTHGIETFKSTKAAIKRKIDSFIQDDIVQVDKLENDWFPDYHGHIFLSHSHADEKLAIGFAVYLQETFGVRTFIDSCIWGNVNDLLKEMNERYSVLKKTREKTIYKYDEANFVASHAYMILNVALQKMIDSSECLFFLNTPNSLKFGDAATGSPWIYSELFFSQMVSIKEKEHRDELQHGFCYAQIQSKFPVDLKHLKPLTQEDFIFLEKDQTLHHSPRLFLDALYERTGVKNNAE